jgi:hypothetical protein
MYYKRQTRDIKAMSGMDQAFNLAKALREIPSPPSKIPEYRASPTPTSPLSKVTESGVMGEGRSIATELRMKIQKEKEEELQREEQDAEDERERAPPIPPRSASRSAPSGAGAVETQTRSPVPMASPALFITNTDNDSDNDDDLQHGVDEKNEFGGSPTRSLEGQGEDGSGVAHDAGVLKGDDIPLAGEGTGTTMETLEQEDTTLTTDIDNAQIDDKVTDDTPKPKPKAEDKVLLASPIPLEDTQTRSNQIKVQPTSASRSPSISVDPPATTGIETATTTQERGMYSPSLDLPNANMIDLPPRFSPDMREPRSPWSPSSPASPHSVTATRHAVQVGRSVSDGSAQARMPTLVGKTDGSLLASKGPVPITFLVDGAGVHRSSPSPVSAPAREGLGLGMPSTSLMGRISPVSSSPIAGPGAGVGVGSYNARRAATSPLAGGESPRPHLPMSTADPDSRFPSPNPLVPTQEIKQTYTPVITPSSPEMSNTARMSAIYPRKTRSRSFGATMARAMGRGKKDKEKVPDVPLTIDTKSASIAKTGNGNGNGGMKSAPIGGLSIANMPPPSPGSSFSSHMPPSPGSVSLIGSTHRHDWTRRAESPSSMRNGEVPPPQQSRKASAPAIIHSAPTAPGPPIQHDDLPPPIPLTKTTTIDSQKSLSPSLHPTQSRTPSFSNQNQNNKKKSVSPAGISHTDFAEATVKADGLDFEIVQPRSKRELLSPTSPSSTFEERERDRPGMKRSDTSRSDVSGVSARSLPLPETDEWGFLKGSSPTPEMYMSRNTGSDHRVAEGKWVRNLSSPLS